MRGYTEELVPDVLDGASEPGKAFDATMTLDEAPDGCRAMDQRTALTALITP